jgi:hypothetical protein
MYYLEKTSKKRLREPIALTSEKTSKAQTTVKKLVKNNYQDKK